MRILYVAAGFPHPLLRGYQVRAYHQLRLLSRRHRLTLLHFVPTAFGWRQRPSPESQSLIAQYCDQIIAIPLRPSHAARALARGLFDDRPLQTQLYDTHPMRAAIRGALARDRYDVVHIQLPRMAAPFESTIDLSPGERLRAGTWPPRVLDMVDSLALNMERRSTVDRGPMRSLARVEAGRLRWYERRLCQDIDRVTVVSEVDRAAIGDFNNLTINANGVDLESFPFQRAEREPKTVLFTGNLGYFPNVDAVQWFAHEVLPILHRVEPAARFVAVGARPSRSLRALANGPGARSGAGSGGVSVHGDVPSIESFLAHATVAVAPIRAGSGQLFKLLEAMASGAPVVATRIAASGLDAVHEEHLLIADSAQEIAFQVARLLREPALRHHLAIQARRLVERRYGWERSVAQLEAIYESVLASVQAA